MTFEQDDKPDSDKPDFNETSASAGNDGSSMDKKSDHDAWLEQWLARDQKPSVSTNAGQATTGEATAGEDRARETDDNDGNTNHKADKKADRKADRKMKAEAKKQLKLSRKDKEREKTRETAVTDEKPDADLTETKATSKFAAAVAEFQENSPVLLEPGDIPTVEEEVDEDIIIDAGPEPEPTSLGAKFKRALLSDKTTAAFGVIGELLITGGALVLLFLAWQLWINNAIVAGEQAEAVKKFSNELTASPSSSSTWTPKPGATSSGPAPVLNEVGPGGIIGNMYVPRLGSGSTRAVANGVSNPSVTINRGFYGRYDNSQWPGQPGNFAMAVHRTGWGTSFTQAQTIRPGDHFYLETPQGWYIYTVRNTEYVVPTQVTVVNPVPLSDKPAVDGQSIMTITTCSPINGNGERLVIYGILSDWQPIEAGVPAEITKLVQEARG